MRHFQRSLFYNLQAIILSSKFYRKYYLLFKSLPLPQGPDKNYGVGRTGYSRNAILKAFIVKYLEQIKSVPRLIEYLDSHPVLSEMCGFTMGCLPDESQFYRFLKETPNSFLEDIHIKINRKLAEEGIISLNKFIIDSKPVMAATRENNLKNPGRNSRNKTKKPKRNPQATLGYYSCQEVPGSKNNYIFFWGYRTHVIVSKEGIPLVEKTLPNNITDAQVAKKLINKFKRTFRFKKGSVFIGDTAYDQRELYNFIVHTMKSRALFPLNPRNRQPDKILGPQGRPLCEADLEMKSNGIWTEGLRRRIKFRCPIKTDRQFAKRHPQGCPAGHPRFSTHKAYGCTKHIDITNDPRSEVQRDSSFFKNTFKLRHVVEQYFARLGDREVEQTTHYKLRSVQNQMTIAHLSMSLVASAAALLLKRPEKIRCYRTFAHSVMDGLIRQTA